MAEIINIGDSYYKEVEVTYENDGEIEFVDLSIYDDNYVAIKESREVDDSNALIFKPIPIKGNPSDGTLILNLTPEETALLPKTSSDDILSLMVFVQIGSSVTGQVHEVSSFKVKTRLGGVYHITEIDKGYDMGCLTEQVGWIFDAGKLCDQTVEIIDFDDVAGGLIIYNAGSITSGDITIYDAGHISTTPDFVDIGYIRECSSSLESCA